MKKLCLMKMKTKKYILCKKATCEVRKSTLHLNLPTSLSSTDEISRNAVGGDDDRGRDHDVGDDNGDDEDDHDDDDGGNLEPQL